MTVPSEITLLCIPLLLCYSTVSAEESLEIKEEHSPHKLELFLGVTHVESEDKLSLGVTYEYRVNEIIGLGGIVEYTDGHNSWIGAVPVFFHPKERWRFVLAPGIERKGNKEEALIRTGLGYEWEFGDWSIGTELNLDFVDGETNEVLGLSFGRRL